MSDKEPLPGFGPFGGGGVTPHPLPAPPPAPPNRPEPTPEPPPESPRWPNNPYAQWGIPQRPDLPLSERLGVSGGSTSIEADFADLTEIARIEDEVGDDVRTLAGDIDRLAQSAVPAGSIVYSPSTAIVPPVTLGLVTLDPIDGLHLCWAKLEAHAMAVRFCRDSYQFVEDGLDSTARWVQGQVGGLTMALGVVAGASATVTPGVWIMALWLGTGPRRPATETVAKNVVGPRAAEMVWDAPWLTNLGVNGGQQCLGASNYAETVTAAGGLLGAHNPLTKDAPVRSGTVTTEHHSRKGGLAGLMEAQIQTANPKSKDERRTEVRAIRRKGPDGKNRWVVTIPGTRQGYPSTNPFDNTSNARLAAGQDAQVLHGIDEALEKSMKEAGVKPGDEEVMLLGHSQGGLAATRFAGDESLRNKYHVSHVVTAGSPVSHLDIGDVEMLNVEHEQDFIPRLDGKDDDTDGHRVNVNRSLDKSDARDENGHVDLMYAHRDSTYLETFEAIDDSDDPALKDWKDGAGQFLEGESTEYRVELKRDTTDAGPQASERTLQGAGSTPE